MDWFSRSVLSDLNVSLDTLIGMAPILGSAQESRFSVRKGQDPEILDFWLSHSAVDCLDEDLEGFIVSPFDILVEKSEEGDPIFHVIEFNGTGIGGLTNLPLQVAETVSQEIAIQCVEERDALILVAVSGLEDPDHPRYNKVLYEKILYVDRIKQAYLAADLPCQVMALAPRGDCPELPSDGALVLLGYMKDLLKHVELDSNNELRLGGRLIKIVVNDRFFLNILQKTSFQADVKNVKVLNKSYKVGADKSCAYEMLNRFQEEHASDSFPAWTSFFQAHTLTDLTTEVLNRHRKGEKCLIKPSGTGLGHGIEFFLGGDTPEQEICSLIKDSVERVSKYYGLASGAFPYSVCPFVDTAVIAGKHKLAGRKFELRVVVFKKGSQICAVPSIAKISSAVYDSSSIEKAMLINNVSTSSHQTKQAGSDFILPLANMDTLLTLGLDPMQLAELSRDCAKLMAYCLEQMAEQPSRNAFPSMDLLSLVPQLQDYWSDYEGPPL